MLKPKCLPRLLLTMPSRRSSGVGVQSCLPLGGLRVSRREMRFSKPMAERLEKVMSNCRLRA